MDLPNDEIGVSDILDWRECPQRFAFSMRRHVPLPERLQLVPNEKDEPPEKTNWTNAYGSCIHEAISIVEKESVSHDEAIRRAFPRYAQWLFPDHIDLLKEDLNIYERRRPLGVTLVAAERDLRVPLFIHDGVQIYFRFKIDVLYRLISNPSVFIMRDYKSSAWRKTDAEVHSDPQQWAYNFGVHDYYPECRQLIQVYDQLRYGEVRTSKNDEQRRQMKAWLIENVKAIIADQTYVPTLNQWCRFCPLVLTCREPRRASHATKAKLSVMAPLTKDGRKVRVEFSREAFELEDIIKKELPHFIETRKHIEQVEKALKEVIEGMPEAERRELGWRVQDARTRSVAPEGLRELHERMGDSFYELVNLPFSRLEDTFGKLKKGQVPPPELEIIERWTTEAVGAPKVVPAKSD